MWDLHKHKHISKKDGEMWKSWSVSAVFQNINCWKEPCFLLHHFIASLNILSTLYPQCEQYMIRWKAVYIKAVHLLEENLWSTSPVYSFNPLWSSKWQLCPLFRNFSLIPQSGYICCEIVWEFFSPFLWVEKKIRVSLRIGSQSSRNECIFLKPQ